MFYGSKFIVSYRFLDYFARGNVCRVFMLNRRHNSSRVPAYIVDWLGESRQTNVFALFMH